MEVNGDKVGMNESEVLLQKAKQSKEHVVGQMGMATVTEKGGEPLPKQRNPLSGIYKKIFGTDRPRLETAFSLKLQGQKVTKEEVEQELDNICQEIIGLMDKYMLSSSRPVESKVSYLKMKGDHYGDRAEVASAEEKNKMASHSQQAYQEAFDLAVKEMQPTNPIRLGLALNFAVFHFETQGNSGAAIQLAKGAIDDATAELGNITLIMQQLKDKLTLWAPNDAAAPADEHSAHREKSTHPAQNKDLVSVMTTEEANGGGQAERAAILGTTEINPMTSQNMLGSF